VGLAAVKGWAEVHHKPIAAISGLEAIAAQSIANDELVSPFLDARRGHVFGSTYRRSPGQPSVLQLVGEEAILSIEEFLTQVKRNSGPGQAVLVSATPEVLPHELVESILPAHESNRSQRVWRPQLAVWDLIARIVAIWSIRWDSTQTTFAARMRK